MRQFETILPDSLISSIDKNSRAPLYYQLSQAMEALILSGELPAGSRLENETSITERLGISRPTVRKAIQELVDRGFLVRQRGVGTQVVHGQVTRGLELTSLHDDLIRSGKTPRTTLIDAQRTRADHHLADQLGCPTGTELIRIERVRGADSVPVAHMINWLPAHFSGIIDADLEKVGLYEWLRQMGVTIRVARQKIGARKATLEEANALEIDRGSALLTMDRTAYDERGIAVEYGHHCYRPDLYSFQTTLVNK